MPLTKDKNGDFTGAVCLNQCGDLSELDEKTALLIVGKKEPQEVTVLVCPECQYMELYYGGSDEVE